MNFFGAVKRAHELAGVAAFLVALAAGVGFSISPPWATPKDVSKFDDRLDKLQHQQDALIEDSQKKVCLIFQLMRDKYAKELSEAQNELNKNPGSFTLQRARDEAKDNVDYIDSEQRKALCRHVQAPISSFTGPSPTEAPWISVPSIPPKMPMTRLPTA